MLEFFIGFTVVVLFLYVMTRVPVLTTKEDRLSEEELRTIARLLLLYMLEESEKRKKEQT
jgi:hypothetical protein